MWDLEHPEFYAPPLVFLAFRLNSYPIAIRLQRVR